MRALPDTATPTRWRAIAWMIAAAIVLVFAGANAHLVYVATASQPACVPHARLGEASGALSAAQSACATPGGVGAQAIEERP
jgi:hypothetical protein